MKNKVMKLFWLALSLVFVSGAWAGDCRLSGSKCVDASASKTISGVTVTLADAGGCWEYEDTYECLKPDSIDYCNALSKISTCWQSSSVCSKTAFNGECMVETRTYRCNDPSTDAPSDTVKLDYTYTIVKDYLDTSQCDPSAKNPLCHIASHTCTQGAETRIINGLPVYKDCWEWHDDYTCINSSMSTDCQPLIDKGCTKLDSVCIDTDPVIGCTMKQVTYKCITKAGESVSTEDCSAKVMCSNGTCWDTGSPNDQDFGKAVAGLEAAREIGSYASDGINLFRGTAEDCRKGYGGLKNCCKDAGGAKSNNQVMSSAIGQAATYVGAKVINAGSQYAFDFMYPDGGWIDDGMQCINNAFFSPTDFNPSLSFYGLSYGGTFGSLAMGETASGMFGQTVYGLGNGFAFDPYSFVIMVVIQIVMELMSCEDNEKMLSMHKGAGLCHFVGSYCSKKWLGACVETKQSYCCFNSKLGKIINEQGRPQIGKTWGSAQSPDCSGFTEEQFAQLDFSQIDMSEFINEVTSSTKLLDPNVAETYMSNKMNGATTNSAASN